MLSFTFSILTGLLLLLTFITLWRYEAWWVRGMDFPRLQLGVLAAVLLVVELIFLDFSTLGEWLIASLCFICVCYQAWWVIPYTPLFPREVKSASQANEDNTIAILAFNVLTPNKDAAALVQLVREYQPDMLVTLETNVRWQRELDILTDEYPYIIKQPQDNLYGMHVYSRLELEGVRVEFLVESDVPSMHALVKLRSGKKVRTHFLHPAPPSPTENEESSERDAELLLVAKSVAKTEMPVIVAGDLNDVAWSPTTRLFRKVSGLLDPRVGRGMFNSFHAKYCLIRWPLDHLFHSRHFVLIYIKRLPAIGSDHFPMLIKLAYAPEIGAEQEGIDASAEEERWASEKISKQVI